MNKQEMIQELAARFGLEVVDGEEFYGRPSDCLWVRNQKESEDTLPAFDYYSTDIDPNEEIYTMGVLNEVETFLSDNDWFAEPYDSGTWHLSPQ